ncbi:MAG: TIR domain-containing protein [Anaerolineaceae bacterium]|nr:TIR domain-containing protein [Anaerolineaceae bacterium]
MSHVYLSYANNDEEVAKLVRSALEANGVPVWMRERDSRPHDITEALENARCFVVIFSPNARDSRQIHSDFEKRDLPVFSLLVNGDFRYSVIYGFLNAQLFDARLDFKSGLRKLIAAVKEFFTDGRDNTVGFDLPSYTPKSFNPPEPLPPKYDIYISYRHMDESIMREIRDKLIAEGFSTWVDKIDMNPFASWRTEILRAIEQSRCVLVIITPQSNGSHYVPEDIEYARLWDIPIITLLADGNFSHLLAGLGVGTVLDYRKPNDWHRLIEALKLQTNKSTPAQPNVSPPISTQVLNTAEHYDVFLSYSSKDAEIMKRVRSDLIAAGKTVWTMEGIIPGTANWRRAIEKGIKGSTCMVVLFSPDSAASDWVNEELSYAELQKKATFSLLVRGEPKDSIPYGYTLKQTIDVRTDDKYILGLPRLLSTLETSNTPST